MNLRTYFLHNQKFYSFLLLYHLDNDPACRWRLGVPVDQGASVVVEDPVVDPQLFPHHDVVDGERVVGLERRKVGHRDARLLQCPPRRRDGRLGHACLFSTRKPVGKNLDGHRLVGGHLIRLLLCGDDHAGIAIGWMGLGGEGQDGVRRDRLQPCQALSGTGDDPLILFHQDGLFLGKPDLQGKHIAFLELAVLCRRIRVLVVSAENQGIGFLACDAVLLGDVVGGPQGAGLGDRIPVETVHHPALVVRLSAGARRVRPEDVRAVRCPIRGRHQDGGVASRLDAGRGVLEGDRGGGARLGDPRTADLRIAHQRGEVGGVIEPQRLGNGRAIDDAVEDIRRDPPQFKEPFRRGSRQLRGILILQRSLPTAEGRAPVPFVGNKCVSKHFRLPSSEFFARPIRTASHQILRILRPPRVCVSCRSSP